MSGTCLTFDKVRTCPSNILIRMFPVPTTLHSASFTIRSYPPSHGWYVLNHSLLGHMWYVAPSLIAKYPRTVPIQTELLRSRRDLPRPHLPAPTFHSCLDNRTFFPPSSAPNL